MAEQSTDCSIRELICLIEGDSSPFKVKIAANKQIFDLKEIIYEGGVNVASILVKDLSLLKVDIDLNGQTADSLRQIAIEDNGNHMLGWLLVSKFWRKQPNLNRLHIFVKLPPTTDSDFLAIYQRFWNGEHLFVKHPAQIPSSSELGGDPEMLEFAVIDLPEGSQKAFSSGVSRLLVPPIYETFWDLLEHEDQRWQALPQSQRFTHLCHATIVTGQPGVGKSVFLIYVLLRRLANGMTTIYCDKGTYVYIFDHTGVRRLTLSNESRIPELDKNSKCCALVNLGDKLKLVPEVFYPQLRKGRVVVATPPNKEHWSSFSHNHPAKTYCMPTWEWGQLYFASLLYACKDFNKLDPVHWKKMRETYSIFRGIPRSCLWSLNPDVLEAQKAEIKSALASVTFLDDFAREISGQNPNTSHCLVRVEPIDTEWFTTRAEIKSNYIAELMFERFRILTRARFSDKLMEYLSNPTTRGPGGVLFEQAAHYSIRKGLTLTMAPLPSGTTLDVSIPSIPAEKYEKSRYCSLSIREKPGSHAVHPDFLNLYMTPQSKNEPSIDALFISSEHITYLFQMTVSPSHSITFEGLDKVFKCLPAKAQKDVRIVFIIPAKGPSGKDYEGIQTVQSIVTPQRPDVSKVEKFKGFPQYVCRLDTSKIGWDEENHVSKKTAEDEESGENFLSEIPSNEDKGEEAAEDREEKEKAKKEKREREKKEKEEKKEREKKEKKEREKQEKEEKKKGKGKNVAAPKRKAAKKAAEEEDEEMGDVQDDPEAEQDAQESGKKRKKPTSTSGKPVPKRAKLASTSAKLLEDYDAEE